MPPEHIPESWSSFLSEIEAGISRAGYQMHVPKQIEAAELIAVIASGAERIWEA